MESTFDMECSDCGLRGEGRSSGVGRVDTLIEDRAAWCRHCEAIVSAEYVRPLAELRQSNPFEMLASSRGARPRS